MSLKPADGDGLVFRTENTSAFAQFLHWAYTRAGGAKQIGLQDSARRATQILGRNFLDELWYVDVRWAGVRARGVVAHQATCCFQGCFVARQCRQKFVERIRPRSALRIIRQHTLLS